MFALEIRFLTGRYAAARTSDPDVPEWPPHPARVFSALVAALHEEPSPREDERAALQWLEEAGPPEILAPPGEARRLGQIYVPTNDQSALPSLDRDILSLEEAEAALAAADTPARLRKAERARAKVLSTLRKRSLDGSDSAEGRKVAEETLNRRLRPQPRPFPAAVPEGDVVHMVWQARPDPGPLRALDALAARVARLGHSSSLVAMRAFLTEAQAVAEDGRHRWVPSEDGTLPVRVVERGQLQRLEEAHRWHRQVEPRVLPAVVQPYRRSDVSGPEPLPASLFSRRPEEWIVFGVVAPPGGRRHLLDISLAQEVARAMRGLLLRHLDLGVAPPSLTGHEPGGSPAANPHLAFVPLAHVGAVHATGTILGIALVPPPDLPAVARNLLLRALYDAEKEAAAGEAGEASALLPPPLRLTLGRHGVLHLRRLTRPADRRTLDPRRWCGPSRRWATVTAIALGRNPGKLDARDPDVVARAEMEAEATIVADCERIGLPRPEAVWIHRRSLLQGAPAARRFMPFPRQGSGPRRVCVHAEVLFGAPVHGPVILGAGRFFGLGLCAPLREIP